MRLNIYMLETVMCSRLIIVVIMKENKALNSYKCGYGNKNYSLLSHKFILLIPIFK
jgi:hypothetical protein